MHSYLIIADHQAAKVIANSIAPYKIGESIDNFFVDTKEKISIDTIRDIKKFLKNKPYQNTHKIIYINSAHLLTPQAQNSLLKTLEEPPNNSLIFLVTTNVDKLLPTVVSRCQIVKDNHPPQKNSSKNEFEEIKKELKKLNPGQIISLAGKYAYPKTKAKLICQDAIYSLESSLKQSPTAKIAANLNLAHDTYLRLENNVDPKLSLEHFFFHFQS
jgi:replication-associated recombination protein RarA